MRRSNSLVGIAAVFGGGVLAAQLGQVAWLVAGSRALPLADFGVVLAAQALYGLLLYGFDHGSALHGARLAAAGSLDAPARGAVVRTRLAGAFAAAVATLTVGLLGGAALLTAVAPFVPAFLVAAAFSYWAPFGAGDARPWATYLVVRAWGPALAAMVAVALGADLPLFVPGVVECVGIVSVIAAYRLPVMRDLRLAARASENAWRATVGIGLPNVLWQVGLLGGPVVLAATRSATAAAILAVGVRLLTGVNQLCGIVATALFRSAASDESSDRRSGTAWAAVCIGGLGLAALLFSPAGVVALLAATTSASAETAAVTAVAAGSAVGLVLVAAMTAVARNDEATLLRPLGGAAAISVLLYGAAAIEGSAAVAAAALLAGQLLSVTLLAARLPALAGPAVGAAAVAAIGLVAAHTPALRLPSAIALSAVAAITLLRLLPRRAGARGVLDAARRALPVTPR